MFKYRIISFAALLGLLAGAVFWQTGGGYLFLLLATIAGTLLAHELTRLFEGLGMASHRKFVAGFSGVTICVVGLIMQGFSLAGLLAGLWLFFWCGSWGYILFAHDRKRAVKELLHSCGVFFFTMGIALPLVILYGKGPVDQDNILMLIYMVLVTKAGDTGAYIVGMLSNRLLPGGNHKVVPAISPKKSWEGVFGGLALSLGVSFALGCGVIHMPILVALAFGILLFFGSFAGDLTESVLKRTSGIKDSGNIIPGMGGVFDVLDSFIYNGWIFLILKVLF